MHKTSLIENPWVLLALCTIVPTILLGGFISFATIHQNNTTVDKVESCRALCASSNCEAFEWNRSTGCTCGGYVIP